MALIRPGQGVSYSLDLHTPSRRRRNSMFSLKKWQNTAGWAREFPGHLPFIVVVRDRQCLANHDLVRQYPRMYVGTLHDAVYAVPRELPRVVDVFGQTFDRIGFRMGCKVKADAA